MNPDLDLIGNDSTRTQRCADFVRSDRVKVAQSDGSDTTFIPQVAKVVQRNHVVWIFVVMPVKLNVISASKPQGRKNRST